MLIVDINFCNLTLHQEEWVEPSLEFWMEHQIPWHINTHQQFFTPESMKLKLTNVKNWNFVNLYS